MVRRRRSSNSRNSSNVPRMVRAPVVIVKSTANSVRNVANGLVKGGSRMGRGAVKGVRTTGLSAANAVKDIVTGTTKGVSMLGQGKVVNGPVRIVEGVVTGLGTAAGGSARAATVIVEGAGYTGRNVARGGSRGVRRQFRGFSNAVRTFRR